MFGKVRDASDISKSEGVPLEFTQTPGGVSDIIHEYRVVYVILSINIEQNMLE